MQGWSVLRRLVLCGFAYAAGLMPDAVHAAPDAPRLTPQRGVGLGCGLADEPSGRYWATGSGAAGIVLVHADTGAVVASRSIRSAIAYSVYCPVAVSAGGRLVAYGDGVFLRVWDPASDTIVFSFEFARELRGVSFSADGRRLAATTYEDSLRVWDVEGFDLVRAIKPPRDVWNVALSPDGQQVVANGSGAWIWEVDTGAVRLDFSGPLGQVLRFSPDGRWIALGGAIGGSSTVVRADDGALVLDMGTSNNAVAFSPDGSKLAFAGRGGTPVEVRSTKGFAPGTKLGGHRDNVRGLGFRESGGRLLLTVIMGDPLSSKVPTADSATWDVEAKALVRPPHAQRLLAPVRIAGSGDGRWLAVSTPGNETVLWDLQQARLSRRIAVAQPGSTVTSASAGGDALAFTPDGRQLVVGTQRAAEIRDVATGATEITVMGDAARVVICDDGLRLATSAGVWNLRDGSAVGDGRPRPTDASRDCAAVVAATEGYERGRYGFHLEVWDVGARRLRSRTRWIDELERASVRLSPDGAWIAAQHVKNGVLNVLVWDARTGEKRHEIRNASDPQFDPDSRRLAVVRGDDGTVAVHELASGKAVRRLEPRAAPEAGRAPARISSVEFSPDGRRLVVAGDGEVAAWDVGAGARVWTQSAGWTATHVAGGRWIARADRGQASVTLLDAASGTPIATLVADADDWLIHTPQGSFTGSRGADRLAVVVRGVVPSRLDQLALTENRPDRVLERLGSPDVARIAHYRKLHERRLRKHERRGGKVPREIDPAGAPRVQIDTVELEGREAIVRFTAEHPGGSLASYDIVVNGVSTSPSTDAGAKARSRAIRGTTYQGTERVVLEPGDNWLELTAFDDTGVESYRDYRQIRVGAEAEPARDLYVLAFGISDYPGVDLDLDYAHKDAQDLGKLLAKAPGFRRVFTQIHVDAEVTRESIEASAELLARASIDDTVIVFVAGHGVHDRGAGQGYYYLTHEAQLGDLAATAAPFDTIEALLAATPARRKLLLLDTCESGEHSEDAVSAAEANATSRGLEARTSRALVFKADDGAKPDRTFLLERDLFIHVDLSARTGAVILSSSRGGELSYESDALENGMFTEAVLQALTGADTDRDGDGGVCVGELEAAVAASVAAASGGAQNPVVERANPLSRLVLPRIDVDPSTVSALPLPANALVTDPPRATGGRTRADPPAHQRARGCTLAGPPGEPGGLAWLLLLTALTRHRSCGAIGRRDR